MYFTLMLNLMSVGCLPLSVIHAGTCGWGTCRGKAVTFSTDSIILTENVHAHWNQMFHEPFGL